MNMENKIVSLTNELKNLSNEDRKNIIMFAKNREWGIALDTLCSQLYENDVSITKDLYNTIIKLGKKMNMDILDWEYLKEIIK